MLGTMGSIYGYWGAFTRSGSRYYDEMDALYPFFVLLASGLVVLIALVLLVVAFIRERRANPDNQTNAPSL